MSTWGPDEEGAVAEHFSEPDRLLISVHKVASL